MSKYQITATNKFKRDYKRVMKQNKNIAKIDHVISLLAKGEKLPDALNDHDLKGNMVGHRECHIEPDWLLVYRVEKEKLVLVLCHTGSHSRVLRK